jgi:hypothetical protein
MMAMTERSVRENVGGGWGEADRDVMTGYQQKRLEVDPEILMRRNPSPRVKRTRSNLCA